MSKLERTTFYYEGNQYCTYGHTREEAIRKKIKMLDDLKNGRPVKQNAKKRGVSIEIDESSTVEHFAQIWLETYVEPTVREAGLSKAKGTMTKKTYAMYLQKMQLYILPAIGKLKLKDVNNMTLQKILNDMGKRGLSKSTAEKTKIVLKKMFTKAVNLRVLTYNPSSELSVFAGCKEERRSLTAEERRVLETVAKKHRCGLWVLFLLKTGVRPGESAAIRVRDLDFDQKIIHIREAIESGTENQLAPPKSKAGIRDVPLPLSIEEELRAAISSKHPDDFVFTQLDGKSMMTTTVIVNNWRSFSRQMDLEMGAETTAHGHIYDPKDVDKNGVPFYPDENGNPKNGHRIAPDLVLYCLRHTFCTDMQKAGVSLKNASVIMGHEDINITARIYSHSDVDDVRRVGMLMSEYDNSKIN